MYVSYPDIPRVPDNLLLKRIEDIVKLPTPYSDEMVKLHGDVYMAWYYNSPELKQFLQPYFDFELQPTFIYHRVGKDIPIHIDNYRKECYNYIIDCGGDDVYTNFYDDDKNLVYSEKLPSFTWHKLNVSANHNVTGIEDGRTRFAITIEVPQHSPFV